MDRIHAMRIFNASPIYAITAEKLSAGRTDIEFVQAVLAAGVRLVQYREKEKNMRDMYHECCALRQLTRQYDAVFLIDDFVGLAQAVDADGVHVGQEDLPPDVVRQLLGPDKVIGLSTHDVAQLDQASTLSGLIDYIGVGPVFPTQTKKNPSPVTGLSYVRYAVQHSRLPFVAIGGIKEHNIAAVAAAGARTAAVVSDITGAGDIAEKIAALRAGMASPKQLFTGSID